MIRNGSLLALVLFSLIGHAGSAAAGTWRIIGGRPVSASETHGTVAITWTDGMLQCTGTLIAPRVVLSAAHCFVNDEVEPMVGFKPSEFQVFVNTIDASQPAGANIYKVTKLTFHPGYLQPGEELDETSLGRGDDIAVLVLDRAVTNATPVPVLTGDKLAQVLRKEQVYVIAGFGIQDMEGNADNKMHIATIPFERNSDWELLLGNTQSTDTCNGDSGGPAYVVLDGKLYVVGVTSRAVSNATKPCGEGGIYTMAPKYIDWLKQNSDSQYQVVAAPSATVPSSAIASLNPPTIPPSTVAIANPLPTPTITATPSTTTPSTSSPSSGTTSTSPTTSTTTPNNAPNSGSTITTQDLPKGNRGGCSVNTSGSAPVGGLAMLCGLLGLAVVRRRNQL